MQVRPGVASSRAVSDATQTLAKPCLRFCTGVKTRPTLLTPSCATVTAAIETTAPSTSQTDKSPAAIRGPTSSCPLGRAPASAQNRSDQSRSSEASLSVASRSRPAMPDGMLTAFATYKPCPMAGVACGPPSCDHSSANSCGELSRAHLPKSAREFAHRLGRAGGQVSPIRRCELCRRDDLLVVLDPEPKVRRFAGDLVANPGCRSAEQDTMFHWAPSKERAHAV